MKLEVLKAQSEMCTDSAEVLVLMFLVKPGTRAGSSH